MYYILECDVPETENGEALMEVHNCFEVGNVWNWRDGLELEEDERDVPVPVEVGYDVFHGYEGPPPDLVDECVPLMSKRLADTLTEIGIANIEWFPSKVINSKTGEQYDYFVFKLIGLVAAADMDNSDWVSYDGKPIIDTGFKSLVLYEVRANASGLLMFRLEENINALMVHEKVREHILGSGFDTLRFIKPEGWVQL